MMFVAEITARLAPEADPDEVNSLLGSWRQNGQVLGNEFGIVQIGQTLRAFVLTPEADALSTSHDNK